MRTAVVVPNWNGRDSLGDCLDSLLSQTLKPHIIVVENGSSDGSLEFLQTNYPGVQTLINKKNLGFAGGVNVGVKQAIADNYEYVALFNNDAVADKDWLTHLVATLESYSEVGIATPKIISRQAKELDSTGEMYSIWGLPFPRGRGETDLDKYDQHTYVFGASGGASLYRIDMLNKIGLFDEDFFAYYEDVDLSFRAQLAGWEVRYVPTAIVHHQIGATSSKIKGFVTYQTLKNLPLLLWKNVPWAIMPRVWPRLLLAHTLFGLRALSRGQFSAVAKGYIVGAWLWPKKLVERHRIQHSRKVSSQYIWGLMVHDLPPSAKALRKLVGRL
ncbi:MAG TPA: glycosyltransferase family 2 protein [Candidatus Saccharimonadales bacterium]|nr:glycosyltransferase family 2 protein [Candidatus Saccharimonadales bacterium]